MVSGSICRIFWWVCLIMQILVASTLVKGMHDIIRRDGVLREQYFRQAEGSETVGGYCSHFKHSPKDISFSSNRFIRGGSLMWWSIGRQYLCHLVFLRVSGVFLMGPSGRCEHCESLTRMESLHFEQQRRYRAYYCSAFTANSNIISLS